ncbi:DNA replication/repair protein RecF [Chthonomonas calidirosea]|uniref:DNA replication/repair protein RecF n=1 Tax=Chthonomonas calidirosea TaxID=454171 RepID=UPI0006EC4BC9|nr:DNA replication/repair protein RecF [Chthonomonas calidirosea]CEK18351.1 DNA replication and repair protein RecF [Chthonomonas calidirosea]
MHIRRLYLTDFRNYAELVLEPTEGMNILYGKNAQGKTNVLEAIVLLATTRSMRAGRDSQMIRAGAERAQIHAEIVREREGEVDLFLTILPTDRKSVQINHLKRERVLDLLGQFNAVFFGASELAIISGEPADRRHFLNMEISQISPRYVYDLAHYRRVLEQRNRLLRDLREMRLPRKDSGLEVWNEQLVRYGTSLIRRRLFYIERLTPLAAQIHAELTDGKEKLELRYQPGIDLTSEELPRTQESGASTLMAAEGKDAGSEVSTGTVSPFTVVYDAEESQLRSLFERHLQRVLDEELRRGTTLIGPQRDDLVFLINGVDARIYASQGQQRTVALSLKLAEFCLMERFIGEPPVMLLDDVMSDLDDVRRRRLLKWVQGRCQTFLTCTNLRSFPKEILREAAVFHVRAGTVCFEGFGTHFSKEAPEQPIPKDAAVLKKEPR